MLNLALEILKLKARQCWLWLALLDHGYEYTMNKKRLKYLNALNNELIKQSSGKVYSRETISACRAYLNYKPRVTIRASTKGTVTEVTKKAI